jgi:hypothetical protein
MAALAVASTAVSVISEVQSAQAQNKAIGAELRQGYQQVAEQQASQMNDRAREARKEHGRMMVAAGEAGLQLSSGSVEAMLLDSEMQKQLADANIRTNAEHQDQNLTGEANRMYSQVQQPSIIGAGLRLVSSGVSGYAAGRSAVLARQVISQKAAGPVTG